MGKKKQKRLVCPLSMALHNKSLNFSALIKKSYQWLSVCGAIPSYTTTLNISWQIPFVVTARTNSVKDFISP